ncbi:MAG TPA: hypothetical protein VFL91_12350 [Thermomicrobiales bacterium]|nr:hypothetical protein [Thermomicrobiales bacterium]
MTEGPIWERAYLLRLWREGAQWRASLLVTATGERRGFGSLERLFAFLQAETRPDPAREREEEA